MSRHLGLGTLIRRSALLRCIETGAKSPFRGQTHWLQKAIELLHASHLSTEKQDDKLTGVSMFFSYTLGLWAGFRVSDYGQPITDN